MAYSTDFIEPYMDVTAPNEEHDAAPCIPERMARLEAIYRDETWLSCMAEIEAAEDERRYCKHDISHLMDVARIAYIYSLEEDLKLARDVIYAAALLHDIGRSAEYRSGISHDEAGAIAAAEILSRSHFTENERAAIINSIRNHRGSNCVSEDSSNALQVIIKRADKQSRLCFACEASETCNWSEEKKNHSIEY